MRVVLAAEAGASRTVLGQPARDRRRPVVEPLEHVRELRLEVRAVEEDEVGLDEVGHVALARLVEVRVDAGAHQRLDPDAIAADALGGIRHHPRRGDDPERELGGPRRGVLVDAAAARREGQQEDGEHQQT